MVPTSVMGREARRVTRERPRPREEPVIRYVAILFILRLVLVLVLVFSMER